MKEKEIKEVCGHCPSVIVTKDAELVCAITKDYLRMMQAYHCPKKHAAMEIKERLELNNKE